MNKNSKEYREIIGERIHDAYEIYDGPLDEDDKEYLEMLSQIRADHAEDKARKKRRTNSLLAACLALALMGSGYILGMKSDVTASADPDDERKVVQQGDNIVIGTGVSEDDENVGVVTKTYYEEEVLPNKLKETLQLFKKADLDFNKAKVVKGKNIQTQILYLEDAENNLIEIIEEEISTLNENNSITDSITEKMIVDGRVVQVKTDISGVFYIFEYKTFEISVYIPNTSKITIGDILRNFRN